MANDSVQRIAEILQEHDGNAEWVGPECAESVCRCGWYSDYYYEGSAMDEAIDAHAEHVAGLIIQECEGV